ncbi:MULTISPECIES: HAD-IA family hydrolase [Bacillus]|uniref:Phosphoglycolate phosphatase n=1 Tax=Bacillus thuringiensis serovar sooncheon TaxID=180891 RepID=A0A9Q5SM65_BACTU|nr:MULTISPECIES: HAD-IA family hydrolase [Bacillus]MDC7974928.1 HAD-IA family hydrolase [Bacillus sp. BLCC-B18]OTW71883.1 phosphoglycolate phosphatase [Bacillus thuringiensis serovar coreanensis]OTX55503.1 phosphoglycolate phosphatase [Bacillus thuringiensis serovar sooncheon]OTX58840.1 phosphoglycolate phosphatase [Bacillus thuringiensis serovar guiyangiensis]OTX72528.1 phosphoglycolate phosphatase [Bacillus thuringiensis serovar roskildiensis]
MNILWDFDGTLFDTYPVYTKIFSQVLGKEISEEEIYAKLKISFSHAINYYEITKKQLSEIDVLESRIMIEDIKPFEKVEEVLKFGDKNVIMTHKDRAGVLSILNHYGWDKYFVDMVTIDDGFPRKPNALSYDYLHKKHSIDLAIGDRELDLIPAKELGISTCMFQGNCDVADYSLSHYSEFFKIVMDREVIL